MEIQSTSATGPQRAGAILQAQTLPQDRPSLPGIERDFQVADDSLAEWSPKLGGAIPIPFAESRTLTTTEGRLLDRLTRDQGLLGLSEFRAIRDDAFAVSADAVAGGGEDGHQDAFRHAYWSARLTSAFGDNWARQFTTAHEALPGNPGLREAMDLYNNSIGHKIAVDNPRASPRELAALVQSALDNGDLVVISGNATALAWSDQISEGSTGRADASPVRAGRIPVPDGTASVR